MPVDRPYQSHLFNFLNRNFQAAKDNAGLFWRKFKLAVTWGAQLSLYPFYAVVKASRLAGKELGAAFRNEKFQIAAEMPPSDRPIATVLQALNRREIAALPAGEADCLMITLAEGTAIQAIASSRQSQRLVLVTTDNRVLDLLSNHQQEQLRQRIIYEIASYWNAVRMLHRRVRRVERLAQRVAPIAQFLAPAREKFAIAAASLRSGLQSTAIAPKAQAPSLIQTPTLQVSVAQVAIAQRSTPQVPTLWRSPNWAKSIAHSRLAWDNVSDFPALIQAALHYFFGTQVPRSVWGRSAVHTPVLESAQSRSLGVDPWLASVDLKVDLKTVEVMPDLRTPNPRIAQAVRPILSGQVKPPAIALPAAQTLKRLPGTFKQWVQALLPAAIVDEVSQKENRQENRPSAATHSLRQSDLPKPELVATRLQAIDLPAFSSAPSIAQPATLAQPQRTNAIAAPRHPKKRPPSWFDVSATSLGYNVSWLDRAVQLLDRIILVLEQLFLSFYAWLKVLRESR